MPNWADDEGRYHWTPPGKQWFEAVEIPHSPVSRCRSKRCAMCEYYRQERKKKRKTPPRPPKQTYNVRVSQVTDDKSQKLLTGPIELPAKLRLEVRVGDRVTKRTLSIDEKGNITCKGKSL
jgi:hypothetical protein